MEEDGQTDDLDMQEETQDIEEIEPDIQIEPSDVRLGGRKERFLKEKLSMMMENIRSLTLGFGNYDKLIEQVKGAIALLDTEAAARYYELKKYRETKLNPKMAALKQIDPKFESPSPYKDIFLMKKDEVEKLADIADLNFTGYDLMRATASKLAEALDSANKVQLSNEYLNKAEALLKEVITKNQELQLRQTDAHDKQLERLIASHEKFMEALAKKMDDRDRIMSAMLQSLQGAIGESKNLRKFVGLQMDRMASNISGTADAVGKLERQIEEHMEEESSEDMGALDIQRVIEETSAADKPEPEEKTGPLRTPDTDEHVTKEQAKIISGLPGPKLKMEAFRAFYPGWSPERVIDEVNGMGMDEDRASKCIEHIRENPW